MAQLIGYIRENKMSRDIEINLSVARLRKAEKIMYRDGVEYIKLQISMNDIIKLTTDVKEVANIVQK
jgi:hypothetical protein